MRGMSGAVMCGNTKFLSGVLIGLIGGLFFPSLTQWVSRGDTTLTDDLGLAGAGRKNGTSSEQTRLVHDRKVAEQVMAGGLILHIRHGNRQKWDSVIAFDVFEMATGADGSAASYRDAVCLTSQGVEEGKMIGEIFRLSGTRISHVVASPSCRAQQTAELAFGRIDETERALAHTPVVNRDNAQVFAEELGRLYRNVPISPGSNVAFVAHGNTLQNHPDLFSSGAEKLSPGSLLETGFHVIRRQDDGTLELVHTFGSLGDFAAAAITLHLQPE